MSRQEAQSYYERRGGDPTKGYVSAADAQAALGVVYRDMAAGDWAAAGDGPPRVRWKGGNASVWQTAVAPILTDAADLELNIVTVPVKVRAADTSDSLPAVDPDSLALAQQIVAALPPKVGVIAEPYPFVADGNLSETDWNPADKTAWFIAWRAACVTVAQAIPRASMVYIASNLVHMERAEYAAQWRNVIEAVRAVTTADVSMRVNYWYSPERFEQLLALPTLRDVDVVAVAAYFELTPTHDPAPDEIRAALHGSLLYERWQNIVGEVEQIALATGADIYFGELNCGAHSDALSAPWNPDTPGPRSLMVQRRLFDAYTREFSPYPWWRGFSIFNIGHPWADSGYLLADPARKLIRSMPCDPEIDPPDPPTGRPPAPPMPPTPSTARREDLP